MKILIAAGGSGGHVFPALYVAQELRKNNHKILFVTTDGIVKEKINQKGFKLRTISARGISLKSPIAFLSSLFCMVRASFESFFVLLCFRPQRVVGFGGYGAFPVLFVASLLRRPTLIHEQNVVLGRANRILAKMVNRIAISFQESEQYLPKSKVALTGCPCRTRPELRDKEKIFKKFHLDSLRKTILVLGGSQGSHRINDEFLTTAHILKEEAEFQVIHISGKSDYEQLKKRYEEFKIPFYLTSFLDHIEEAYEIADLVISRAGAVTVFEMVSFHLPVIFIPYPYAGGHQKENAKILEKTKTACMIEEKILSPEILKGAVLKILRNPVSKDVMAEGRKDIFIPDAAKRIAQEVLALSL